jgi:hypothetical protein
VRHGDTYIEVRIQQRDMSSQTAIADYFRDAADIVAGPTTGIILLRNRPPPRSSSIIAERRRVDGREFKRGFQIGPGDRPSSWMTC